MNKRSKSKIRRKKMTKERAEKKKAIYEKEYQEMNHRIIDTILSFPLLSEDEKKECLENIDNEEFIVSLQTRISINTYMEDDPEKRNLWKKFQEDLDLDTYSGMLRYPCFYSGTYYLDSEPVHFKGDIIITDPCYIERDDRELDRDQKDRLFKPYMERDTIYGDWSCTTYDEKTNEVLGKFCADSGMVGVFLLDDVLTYNPKFNFHTDNPHTTTWIPDFDGIVQFVVNEVEFTYENEKHIDYELHVVGHGINMKDGREIHFITQQTGL